MDDSRINKGILKSWNDDKGFGFIKSSTLQHDTFIHISSLKHMSRKPKKTKWGQILTSDIKLMWQPYMRLLKCW